jgi:hypothetical protein
MDEGLEHLKEGVVGAFGGIKAPNPRAETRNPKEIRSPKAETSKRRAATGGDWPSAL